MRPAPLSVTAMRDVHDTIDYYTKHGRYATKDDIRRETGLSASAIGVALSDCHKFGPRYGLSPIGARRLSHRSHQEYTTAPTPEEIDCIQAQRGMAMEGTSENAIVHDVASRRAVPGYVSAIASVDYVVPSPALTAVA